MEFSNRIDPDPFVKFADGAVVLWCTPGSRGGGPVRRLLTDVTVVASRIEVKVVDFDDRIFGELIEGGGGGLLLDIDCDYLRDRKGRLVSGSASTLAGLDGVVAPGGILRLSITATRG